MKALWGLLLSILCFSSLAGTNSYPERLKAVEGLTNPPASYRVVFDYWTRSSMLAGMYEVEAQPEFWKVRYCRMRDQMNNPKFMSAAGKTPTFNWQLHFGKTNTWVPGEIENVERVGLIGKRRIREKSHGSLGYGPELARRLLRLGIGYGEKGTFELKGNDFHWTEDAPRQRRVKGSLTMTKAGALIGATLGESDADDNSRLEVRYVFKADQFKGEFPTKIELWHNNSTLLEKFEVLEYNPRTPLQPPAAFGLENSGVNPQL